MSKQKVSKETKDFNASVRLPKTIETELDERLKAGGFENRSDLLKFLISLYMEAQESLDTLSQWVETGRYASVSEGLNKIVATELKRSTNGRNPLEMTEQVAKIAQDGLEYGVTWSAKKHGVSRGTVYNYIKKYEETKQTTEDQEPAEG